jgi:hypothetical protein
MDGILGPLDQPIVIDEFTYNQVKGAECLGQVRKPYTYTHFTLLFTSFQSDLTFILFHYHDVGL